MSDGLQVWIDGEGWVNATRDPEPRIRELFADCPSFLLQRRGEVDDQS
uniref:Uncharacterized protein n=1 Tax=Microbacterium phage Crisis TaxID=3158889 RepID=A0AAU8GS76_9CAUD